MPGVDPGSPTTGVEPRTGGDKSGTDGTDPAPSGEEGTKWSRGGEATVGTPYSGVDGEGRRAPPVWAGGVSSGVDGVVGENGVP